MTPKEFLKTDKATDFENIAFTAEQWNAVYAWMNDFLTHEGQSLPMQNVMRIKTMNWIDTNTTEPPKGIGKEALHIGCVTHRYFTLSEAKPKDGKPCIVNNGANNYHIAFWDEEANGFVNQTGYLQKEFDKWLYLPINGA